MLKTIFTAAISIASLGAAAETLMKPGLWEMRTVKHVVDGRDMMAQMAASQAQMKQMMANMPPSQRKQMEAMMGKQGAASPDTVRMCVSPEMASRDKPVVSADHKCEPANVSRSGNKMTYEIDCTDQRMRMTGKGESVTTGDTINSKMDMVMTDAQGKRTMQTEAQMKYLGSDCQGIKPADQIAREFQQSRQTPARGK